LVIWLNRRSPKVLLYHVCDVVESEFTQGLGASITPDAFAAHLDYLATHYRVISVQELMSSAFPRGTATITFDDGYRSFYRWAYPRLRERHLPATVYLVSDVIDNQRMIWVNELNWLLRRGASGLVSEAASRLSLGQDDPDALVAAAVQEYDAPAIQDLLERGRALSGNPLHRQWCQQEALYLSSAEIREMADHGVTFGNHTASHPSMPRLADTQQLDQVVRARAELTRHPGLVSSFAYPFGHVNDATRRVVSAAGYRSAMEVGGWNAPWNPARIGRVPVSGGSPADLFAELELIAPLKAWGRRLLTRTGRRRTLNRARAAGS
jgi:peptidoglycan/xylan/chitin deacetylase (PgdA/CDA1 family)